MQSLRKSFQISFASFNNFNLTLINEFHRKLTRSTKCGLNVHRSNRAKRGLYHGKDIRSGHTISHSHVRSKRTFKPNAISKRVWSYALNDWVRFNMTTTALKKIDDIGGIDNYIMNLDERSVEDSNYVTKMRGLIGAALYQKGKLSDRMSKRLGFDVNPPTAEFKGLDDSHFNKRSKIKKKVSIQQRNCFVKKVQFYKSCSGNSKKINI